MARPDIWSGSCHSHGALKEERGTLRRAHKRLTGLSIGSEARLFIGY